MYNLRLIFLLVFVLSSKNSYAQIAITEIFYDTPFDEQYGFVSGKKTYQEKAHHLGEYIELYNYSTEDIPLKGWLIADKSSNIYFPEDAVIKSEDFLLIAFRDLVRKPDIGNYFPIFFPTVVGKEKKIIYQEYLMLRNKEEIVRLYAKYFLGIKLDKLQLVDQVSWKHIPSAGQRGPISNEFTNKEYKKLDGRDFYKPSLHLQEGGNYISSAATPLTSAYVPKTQLMLEIPAVQEALGDNSAKIDWSKHVLEILRSTCDIIIDLVQQFPKGDFDGEKVCFSYDVSGNYIATKSCDEDNAINSTLLNQIELRESLLTNQKILSLAEVKSLVAIYPNPTSGIVHVKFDESIFGKIAKVEIYSTSGANIRTNYIEESQSTTTFDITSYPSGIYLMKFTLNVSLESFNENIIKL
ncbi:T9SS type A sorting domain-containing protein [Flavobacterium sp. NKUCC04_CG]|uniref:T9SS type A sorting domain-containing protein n=1 Tax=Flavobacterium sp. NKUCC04_CG TaxID=2842121 RepID=UPI001C5AAA73|nr:T9SS type A sorting domain-containing protein [Flavobacterium sp. NKUCC04_CG]MBW3518530.1 lamin tail domain-containing protein [Flavobacterium sp. NKUCC04_CG]